MATEQEDITKNVIGICDAINRKDDTEFCRLLSILVKQTKIIDDPIIDDPRMLIMLKWAGPKILKTVVDTNNTSIMANPNFSNFLCQIFINLGFDHTIIGGKPALVYIKEKAGLSLQICLLSSVIFYTLCGDTTNIDIKDLIKHFQNAAEKLWGIFGKSHLKNVINHRTQALNKRYVNIAACAFNNNLLGVNSVKNGLFLLYLAPFSENNLKQARAYYTSTSKVPYTFDKLLELVKIEKQKVKDDQDEKNRSVRVAPGFASNTSMRLTDSSSIRLFTSSCALL